MRHKRGPFFQMCSQQSPDTSEAAGPRQYLPWDISRLTLGVVLLLTGALKCFEVAFGDIPASPLLKTPWSLLAVAELEFFAGIALLCAPFPRIVRHFGIALFVCFFLVSSFLALTGEASCGCAGSIQL